MLLTLILVTGCGSRGEVKELAFKEKAMLNEVEPMAKEINNSYTHWKSGQISREQLAEELSVHYSKINSVKAEWVNARNNLSRQTKNNIFYWNLSYMGGLCTDIQKLIVLATQGYPSSVIKSSSKPLTDNELTATYETELVKNYKRDFENVKSVVSEVIN